MKKLKVLQAQLEEMENYTTHYSDRHEAVSKASIGWHLAHILKVIDSITVSLSQSEPEAYRKSFSWKKELVYLMNKIPRGKARAPKKVLPQDDLSPEELQQEIQRIKGVIMPIMELPGDAFFEHPFFGHLRKDETPKFLVIHTEHHLKIIRDILHAKAGKVNI